MKEIVRYYLPDQIRWFKAEGMNFKVVLCELFGP